jgi:hypothetical protein
MIDSIIVAPASRRRLPGFVCNMMLVGCHLAPKVV